MFVFLDNDKNKQHIIMAWLKKALLHTSYGSISLYSIIIGGLLYALPNLNPLLMDVCVSRTHRYIAINMRGVYTFSPLSGRPWRRLFKMHHQRLLSHFMSEWDHWPGELPSGRAHQSVSSLAVNLLFIVYIWAYAAKSQKIFYLKVFPCCRDNKLFTLLFTLLFI